MEIMVEIMEKFVATPGNFFVVDGDTINCNLNGQRIAIRLRWIDAPETPKRTTAEIDSQILAHWQWGDASKTFLTDLLANQTLIVQPYSQDFFGRWISDAYLNNTKLSNNIQSILCENGMCWHFLPFGIYDFPKRRHLNLYCRIIRKGEEAFRLKKGIWSVPNLLTAREVKELLTTTSQI
ncbi:thermonuclease family protein [Ancylothrix sp. C2]|uniref:thermonuclease family protein n=1 Tax=Ancylothrix sp. D3o TaxID=2953691 RepID=UPI0021BB36B8|nr:thermonuclease family protein [Ancylothrix sp. D3o]MCT7952318.1 thermonuclease family protein [Ancylothrix sp. D3o]